MGRQGLGKRTENGEILADICALNNMIIRGSVFPHCRTLQASWVSPDHRTEFHHLVLARMQIKLKKREVKRSTRTQYSVPKGQDDNRDFPTYNEKQYEVLQDFLDEGYMDIDTQWQQIKEMWTNTCSEILGKKKYQKKRLDFCRHCQQISSEEGKERCS